MQLSDFDFELPPERIAQEPLPDRAGSRMLVVDRSAGTWSDRMFRDLPALVGTGDCLVLNDTRVFPARLFGHRRGYAGHVEVFLVNPLSEDRLTWLTLARPGRKLRSGDRIDFDAGLSCEILGRNEHGERIVRFEYTGDFYETLERIGHVPLPPYIHRADRETDRERYQTVFARDRGSVAAPTAGLHFTPEVLAACERAGARLASITLHVGLGTFQPLQAENLDEIQLHSEWYRIGQDASREIKSAQRVICVGTTTLRTLEAAGGEAGSGETRLFITPGFEFRVAGGLLTNFHLPRSSLLILVAAFAGRGLTLDAYRHAVKEEYRFYSYGDCMLIL
jgi:S-adenosylmethionine:tRNA ribosyltransferase-isomerase